MKALVRRLVETAAVRRLAEATIGVRVWCSRVISKRDVDDAVANKIEVAQLRARVNAMHAEIEGLRAALRETASLPSPPA